MTFREERALLTTGNNREQKSVGLTAGLAWRMLVIGLAFLGMILAISRAEDTGYHVRAVLVRSAEKRMEGQLMEVPKDMRIVCEGDTTGISEGDYVKLEFKKEEFVAGKMHCNAVRWYH